MRKSAFFIMLSGVCLGLVATVSLAAGDRHISVQIVDARGVPVHDAVVEIERPAGGSSAFGFSWRYAMAQRNLAFVPGTLVVPRGAVVAFPNLDSVRHSIYSFSRAARFTIDLYGRDQSRTQRFDVSGTIALGCNIHDQMRGYIRVVDTPYAAKTDVNGVAELSGLSPGSYHVTVWHPQLRAANNELHQAINVPDLNHTVRIPVALR